MLLTEETKKVINLAEIGRGSLISAKNKTWDAAMFSVAAYTVILAFSLFKTGSLSKSIFNAH